MKTLATWKKIVLAVGAIAVLIRIGYIAIGGEVDKEYYVSRGVDVSGAREVECAGLTQSFRSGQERLNSLELMFGSIADDKVGKIALQVSSQGEAIYQANLSLSNINNYEWKRVCLNLPTSMDREYTISLNASPECSQIPTVLVVSEEAAAPEAGKAMADGQEIEGQVGMRYGYLKFPGRLDRAVASALWVLAWIGLAAFLRCLDCLKGKVEMFCSFLCSAIKKEHLLGIAQLSLCSIVIHCSGIPFQEPTKIIFYLLSICTVVRFSEKWEFAMSMADCRWKKAALGFLFAYGGFSLVGQRIFIFPLNQKVTFAGIFVFLAAALWFAPVILSALYWLELLGKNGIGEGEERGKGKLALMMLCALLAPAALHLFANNPGISSPDTYASMITNAHSLHGMYDWHPAFYCMVLRVILTVWDSTYAVIFMQYFFWSYVMLEILLYLRKKGMKDGLLLFVAALSGLNAGNFIHLNTIWKDIPYTLSLLWIFILLVKLAIDYEEYKSKWYLYLELIVALVGVCLYRKNGMVTFAVVAIAMAAVFWRSFKIWGALAIALAIVLLIKFPVYSYFEVEGSGRRGMYIGLGQDILGVYYNGGDVSEDTMKMIMVMTNYNMAEYGYNPTWSGQSYDLNVEAKEFIVNYLDTFLKNPVLMTRAVIDREDVVWDIYPGQNAEVSCVNFYGTQDGVGQWNDYYPARVYRSLHTVMSAATGYTASSQWISAIEWRCGLLTLLGMAAALYGAFRCGVKKYAVVVAPILGHILSLLLSTGWSEFRYFWPLNLMNFFLILAVAVAASQCHRAGQP